MAILKNSKKQLEHLDPDGSFSENDQSFEDLYKTSYSHGLEAIYAIENIDLKSVKRIREQVPDNKMTAILPIQPARIAEESQLKINLGLEFQEWIEPFLLKEPIQVLGLSVHTEKSLLEHGKVFLQDLIFANLHDFVFFKGMGQGHIDEVGQKLKSYLDGRSIEKSFRIDFASWIRSLTASFERKKVYVSLQPYDLGDLFSLTPAESVEVRRLTVEKRQEWVGEMARYFLHKEKKSEVLENVRKIMAVFIKPWMRRRGGFATLCELKERIERVSENELLANQAIKFLSETYFEGGFPLNRYLFALHSHLFCSDPFYGEAYDKVVAKAHSYFYNPDVFYRLADLACLIEREFALQWEGFEEKFVERALRLSPDFRVRKGIQGHLEIRVF